MKSNNKKWLSYSVFWLCLSVNSHYSYGYIPGDATIYGIGTLLLSIPPVAIMRIFNYNNMATNEESPPLEVLKKENFHPQYPISGNGSTIKQCLPVIETNQKRTTNSSNIQQIHPIFSYQREIIDTGSRSHQPMCFLSEEQCFPNEKPDKQAPFPPTYGSHLPVGDDGGFSPNQRPNKKSEVNDPPSKDTIVPRSIYPVYPMTSYQQGILDTGNGTHQPMCSLPDDQCFPHEKPDEQNHSLPVYGPNLPVGHRVDDDSLYPNQKSNKKLENSDLSSKETTVPRSIYPVYPMTSYQQGILDTGNGTHQPMCSLPGDQCFPHEKPDKQNHSLTVYGPNLPVGHRLDDNVFSPDQNSPEKPKDNNPPSEKITVPRSIQPVYPIASYQKGMFDTNHRSHQPMCFLSTDQCFPHEQPDETSSALPTQEAQLPIGPRLEDGSFYLNETSEQEPKSTTQTQKEETFINKSEKQTSLTEATHNHNKSTEAIDAAKSSMSNELFIDLSEVMALTRSNRPLSAFSYGFNSLSLDNTSPDELMASTAIGNYSPAFKREAGSWHNFIQVLGVRGNWKSNTASSSYKGFGLNIGFFREINDSFMAGIMAGLQNIDLNIYNDKGTGKVDRLFIGPFISWYKDNWHIDSALTFITNNYTINWKDGPKYSTSEFKGTDWNIFLGAGYDIHLDSWTRGLTLTPKAELLFIDNQYGKHKEQGKNTPSAIVGSRNRRQLITRAGLEVTYLLPDFEKPTEITALFGIQKHTMNSQKSHYNLPGGAVHDVDTTPGRKDTGFYYGFRFTRMTGKNAIIRLDYSATNTHYGKSDSLVITFEKKF